MNDDQPVSVACRFTGRKCFYMAAGPEEFVRGNYKQHLRESHHIGHPFIEEDELCRVAVIPPAPVQSTECSRAA